MLRAEFVGEWQEQLPRFLERLGRTARRGAPGAPLPSQGAPARPRLAILGAAPGGAEALSSYVEGATYAEPYGIRLLTLHASKGREFRAVAIVGWEQGVFPRGGRRADLEEERRLAYVGITRAKDELALFSAARVHQGERTVERARSPFLAELRDAVV
jgi:hypothetical protein